VQTFQTDRAKGIILLVLFWFFVVIRTHLADVVENKRFVRFTLAMLIDISFF
jgi:uncharacterized membrane protein